MISRLRPLDLTISFEERTYGVGETIDLTIDLMPHRDCQIREGRVDLMLEERWTERSTVTVEVPLVHRNPASMASGIQVGSTTEIKEVVTRHKESSVRSRVVFLESVRLVSGRTARYSVRLEIQPDPPSGPHDAKRKWWLQTVIDVAGARDIKPRHKVTIAV